MTLVVLISRLVESWQECPGNLDCPRQVMFLFLHPRDKCGAAASAGFMKTIAELQPAGVKVVVALCMIRNSVGANCYVADEIITSRAGVRLRVGNTDAEGRMAMVGQW